MAKPLNFNWQAIQQLFIQGYSGADIAKMPEYSGIKPATISARASRGNWMQLRHQTKEIVSKAATDVILNDLKARAEKFLNGMADEVENTFQVAKSIPQKRTLKDLYARMEVMEKINKVGRETFELNRDGPQQVVNIGVVGLGDLGLYRSCVASRHNQTVKTVPEEPAEKSVTSNSPVGLGIVLRSDQSTKFVEFVELRVWIAFPAIFRTSPARP